VSFLTAGRQRSAVSTTAERLDHLEADARRVEERLRLLETRATRPAPAPLSRPEIASSRQLSAPTAGHRPLDAVPVPVPVPVTVTVTAAATRPSLEELLGGRVLAWVGGAAVLVGLVLLFALGVSQGWIGAGVRCLLGGAGSAVLLALGVGLHERRGRTQAARAAAATGLAGAFLTVAVATSAYGLMPAPLGLLLTAVVGAVAVALAIGWAAPVIAGLGIVGALLAPALAGVEAAHGGLWFLALATLAAVAVLVWQRWAWLSLCVALVVTPQWLGWLLEERPVTSILLVLAGFGLLQAVAAIGTALRVPERAVRPLPAVLLAVDALVLGLAGWFALSAAGGRTAALAWLAALALAHLGLGVAARRSPRLSGDLGLLCLTLGVLLADVAYALGTDGVARGAGWAVGAIACAGLTRLATSATAGKAPAAERRAGAAVAPAGERHDAAAAFSGLGVHVALAVASAAPAVDPGTLLTGGAPTTSAVALLAVLAGACLVSARLAPAARVALEVAGLATVALLTGLTLDGAALTIAWALEAAALCSLGARGDRLAWEAGLTHLALAALWCLADQAAPTGLVHGVDDLGAAALGLGAVLGATARAAQLAGPRERRLLLGVLAGGALYAASLAVVGLGAPELRAAQLRLSGLWALAGVGALVLGLRRDLAAVRVGALGLLGVTVAKVFVYDLATQEASYRVASFLGLGVLLLAAAFAYQRLRPVVTSSVET
jgi:uncharacterized membrane protein